ncbi:MAG: nitrous oxide reductase family maturation protein NosD [Rhodospirillaceae bacterium]|nr:nitrous oxide reductase family maturation protein NosD [Rhodospirillaceae bacterium]MBT4219202.1 nitrous oxide reductase family maturation protein NosD [Rhodospirillaceae bacterium]MBT7356014.1 nitrous oxide reductase family maturation protein NosD [Rhodospirillaceae bacterium]
MRNALFGLGFVLLSATFAVPAWAEGKGGSLQSLIDAAEPGDILQPPPGTYAGPIDIDKSIVLDGQGQVTIDAGGKGSVVYLNSDGATLRNLRLVNSGGSHNDIDSGIQVRGNYNVISDNVIDQTLFGIDLGQSDNNVVRRNQIGSKPYPLGIRGDGIRLWYSMKNRIVENTISNSRDMVVWYSADNVISDNTVSNGRYGLHFMYARYNVVEGNRYKNNSVGIFLMYSDGVEVRNNHISHGQGGTGMGIGMKESSDVIIEGNNIVYCATGIYMDVSPFQPDSTNYITNNHIAYNGIGVLMHNDWTGNEFRDNQFAANYVQVSVNAMASAERNDWNGNYWDDYDGFDRDQDDVGDSDYEMRVYADQLWMDVPTAAYYRASPLLSLVDFLERLAPFSEPIVLLRDEKPQMVPAVYRPSGADNAKVPSEQKRLDPFGLKQRLGQ